MEDVLTLKFLKTMAEAVKDVITTEEVAADLVVEEVLGDLEEIEILVEKEKVLEVLDQEVAETEVQHQERKAAFHLTDLQEKAVLGVKEVQLRQEENQVLPKEKAMLQDVLMMVLTDQQVVHLTMLK
jgi:DNA mismatch repair ATPase MutL